MLQFCENLANELATGVGLVGALPDQVSRTAHKWHASTAPVLLVLIQVTLQNFDGLVRVALDVVLTSLEALATAVAGVDLDACRERVGVRVVVLARKEGRRDRSAKGAAGRLVRADREIGLAFELVNQGRHFLLGGDGLLAGNADAAEAGRTGDSGNVVFAEPTLFILPSGKGSLLCSVGSRSL